MPSKSVDHAPHCITPGFLIRFVLQFIMGFGTTSAVLRAGVPGIVPPHVMDQYYRGQKVFELGQHIRGEPDGTASAVSKIERILSGDSVTRAPAGAK